MPSDARTLIAASGEPIAGLCARSGHDAMRNRLEGLSEDDPERQSSILRRALARIAAERAGRLKAPAEDFGAEALRLGRLLREELEEGASLPNGRGFFGGGCGPALFLAALAAVHDDAEFKSSAMRVLAREPEPQCLARLGSLLWTLVTCARLLDDPLLLDAADALANGWRESRLPTAAPCDLQGGAASTLLGLLALHRSRPREALLAQARVLGEHLSRSQNAQEAGSRTGRHAPGWRMARQASRGRSKRLLARPATGFAAGAARGLAFEASLFDARKGSWPMLWSATGGKERSVFLEGGVTAPPAAAARAFMPMTIRPELPAEIRLAATATLAAPPPAADHLCCGALGRAAALVTMGELRTREDWIVSGRGLAQSALSAARARGSWSLPSRADGDPGAEWSFLHGLSGIGYQLLSLSAPGRLPQALALELPDERPQEEAAK